MVIWPAFRMEQYSLYCIESTTILTTRPSLQTRGENFGEIFEVFRYLNFWYIVEVENFDIDFEGKFWPFFNEPNDTLI